MALQFSTACRNAMLDGITSTVGNAGTLEIRSGSAPADCGQADSGTLLATHTLGSPFDAAASGGTLTPNLPSNVNAAATGTAGHWRVKTSGGTVVAQGTCGAGSGDLNLNTTSLVSGGPVQINSWTWTAPGA